MRRGLNIQRILAGIILVSAHPALGQDTPLEFEPQLVELFVQPQPDVLEPRFLFDLREAYYRLPGSGVAIIDIDGDGDLDLVVPGGPGIPDYLYLNQLAETATLNWQALELPTSSAPWRRSVGAGDVDGNGLIDLILHGDALDGHPGSLALLQREPLDWEVRDLRDTTPSATGTTIFDFDRDGQVESLRLSWSNDIIQSDGSIDTFAAESATNFFDDFSPAPSERAEVFEAAMLEKTGAFFQAVVVDLFREGRFDTLISQDFAPNILLRYTADDELVNIARSRALSTSNTDMGLAVGDINGDLLLDVFVSNIFDGLTRNTLHLSSEESIAAGDAPYLEEAIEWGVAATDWGWSSFLIDLNHDGTLDLLVATGAAAYSEALGGIESELSVTPNYLFMGTDGNSFSPLLGTPLDDEFDSRVALPVDIDRDGDLDIIEVHMNAPIRILLNESEELEPVIHLNLEPDAAAWGARLDADYGERQLRRDVVPGQGYLSQAPPELRVPIRLNGQQLQSLRVRWRDGSSTELAPVPEAGIYRLRRPECEGQACASSPGWDCVPTNEDTATRCAFDGPLSLSEQYADNTDPPDHEPDVTEAEAPDADGDAGCSATRSGLTGIELAFLALALICLRRKIVVYT